MPEKIIAVNTSNHSFDVEFYKIKTNSSGKPENLTMRFGPHEKWEITEQVRDSIEMQNLIKQGKVVIVNS